MAKRNQAGQVVDNFVQQQAIGDMQRWKVAAAKQHEVNMAIQQEFATKVAADGKRIPIPAKIKPFDNFFGDNVEAPKEVPADARLDRWEMNETPQPPQVEKGMFRWEPRANFGVAGISCGVRMMQGFYNRNQDAIFKDLIHHLKSFWELGRSYVYQHKGNCFPAKVFIWSDKEGGTGEDFGDYMAELFPEQPPLRIAGMNPASHRPIVTFMWEIPDRIREHEFWRNMAVEACDTAVERRW